MSASSLDAELRCGMGKQEPSVLELSSVLEMSSDLFQSNSEAEQPLQRVPEVKDLGLMLDEKLNFRRHTDRVISKCRGL